MTSRVLRLTADDRLAFREVVARWQGLVASTDYEPADNYGAEAARVHVRAYAKISIQRWLYDTCVDSRWFPAFPYLSITRSRGLNTGMQAEIVRITQRTFGLRIASLVAYDFCRERFQVPELPKVERERNRAKAAVPLTVNFRDDRGRPHSVTGPALETADARRAYAFHGVTVPAWAVNTPRRITLDKILEETNQEVRAALIALYPGGMAKFLRAAKAVKVNESARYGTLWRWGPRDGPFGRITMVQFVEVKNRSPEPDGTYKTYFLSVPPTVDTAQAAVAWTFGYEGWDAHRAYRPGLET